MPVIQMRSRHVWWVAAIAAVLIGSGAGLWAWESRRIGGLMAPGNRAYADGNWDRSAQIARQRLKDVPDDPDALLLLARASARLDRDQPAITTYSRLELSRLTAEDYVLLGRALGRTGQDDLAIKSLEAALAAEPDRPDALSILAPLYAHGDRTAAAVDAAERLARQPGWEARGLMMLGTFRAENRNPAGAATALRQALQLDPTGAAVAPSPVAPMQLLLARSLLHTGQPAEAGRVLETIRSPGSDSESAWLRSRVFLQQSAWEAAATALTGAGSYRAEHPLEHEPGPYVGSARCASCHREASRAVLSSRHSTTFALAREAVKLPLPPGPLADPGDSSVVHSFRRAADGIHVESRVGDRVFRAVARYVFGSPDYYTTLVGPDDRGRPRLLRMSYYDSPRGKGWDVSTGLEPKPSDRAEFLGRELDSRDGVRRCLGCHTSNFRSILDESGPESADPAIGCEACHGPGGNHIQAVSGDFADTAIVSPRNSSAATINEVCSRCHGLGHLDAFSGADEDPGWLRFQSTTMYRSRCYTESGERLHCLYCHDPHRNAATSPSAYEGKCRSCHDSGRTRCPVNPAGGCIECHMPRSWMPSTHSFKSDHNIRVHRRDAASR
jgi:tetratricopeptide (TPR) repeat protein